MTIPATRTEGDADRELTVGSVATATLLGPFSAYNSTLEIGGSARELRARLARRFASAHPDLATWMTRPVDARRTDLTRIRAWTFVNWAILSGAVDTDLDFLLAQHAGAMSRTAEALHPNTYDTLAAAANRLGWSPTWTKTVTRGITLCLATTGGDPAAGLSWTTLDWVRSAVACSSVLTASQREAWRKSFTGVHQVLYEAGYIDEPQRHTKPYARGTAELLGGVHDGIRSVMVAYLEARSSVLRPGAVAGLTNDLACFGEFLAEQFPDVTSLRALQRRHIEYYLIWVAHRPYRGRKNSGVNRQVGPSAAVHAVVTLRTFFDDIGAWGWAERPERQVMFSADMPRTPKLLPRALAPDVDRALMTAVTGLDDDLARIGLTVLRHTGLRIGELLDLELDCVVDYGQHGSWLRVPLGKLNSERTVPLHDTTLTGLDEWMDLRRQQRALPHPRYDRLADFLFVEHGRRPNGGRIRRALAQAVHDAGLTGPDNQPVKIVPHQLRHTWATELANAGMSLQALMALLGHQSPDMTMRYATLASPALREAYDTAIGKLRRTIPVAPLGKPAVPNREKWLQSEMLKTRVAHGYCSRDLVAGACPYANVCEQCDNYVTTADFIPELETQCADIEALHDDAHARGWDSEAARHARVIRSIGSHLDNLRTP